MPTQPKHELTDLFDVEAFAGEDTDETEPLDEHHDDEDVFAPLRRVAGAE